MWEGFHNQITLTGKIVVTNTSHQTAPIKLMGNILLLTLGRSFLVCIGISRTLTCVAMVCHIESRLACWPSNLIRGHHFWAHLPRNAKEIMNTKPCQVGEKEHPDDLPVEPPSTPELLLPSGPRQQDRIWSTTTRPRGHLLVDCPARSASSIPWISGALVFDHSTCFGTQTSEANR